MALTDASAAFEHAEVNAGVAKVHILPALVNLRLVNPEYSKAFWHHQNNEPCALLHLESLCKYPRLLGASQHSFQKERKWHG
jgi:hypothetical protein